MAHLRCLRALIATVLTTAGCSGMMESAPSTPPASVATVRADVEIQARRLREMRRTPSDRIGALKSLARLGPAGRYAVGDVVAVFLNSSDDPSVRQAAGAYLQDPRTRGTVLFPGLLRASERGDDNVRLFALKSLRQVGADDVPHLITALSDSDPEVRLEAAQLLAALRSESALSTGPLRSAAADADPRVRDAARAGLLVFDHTQKRELGAAAVPGLQEFTRHGDRRVKLAGVYGLLQIGPEAGDSVMSDLGSAAQIEDNAFVREMALHALAAYGSRSVRHVKQALRGSEDVRASAAKMLRRILQNVIVARERQPGLAVEDLKDALEAAEGVAEAVNAETLEETWYTDPDCFALLPLLHGALARTLEAQPGDAPHLEAMHHYRAALSFSRDAPPVAARRAALVETYVASQPTMPAAVRTAMKNGRVELGMERRWVEWMLGRPDRREAGTQGSTALETWTYLRYYRVVVLDRNYTPRGKQGQVIQYRHKRFQVRFEDGRVAEVAES